MSDATLRFVVAVDPTGQVKSIQAVSALGNKANAAGRQFGRGLEEGLSGAVKSWARFVAAGAAVAAVFRGVGDTIRKAADAAAARVKEWESANKAWRGERIQRLTSRAALRLSGADEGSIDATARGLEQLRAKGRGSEAETFGGIVQALARSGLSGTGLGAAMRQALADVQQRGHLPGFAEAYTTLAAAKVAPGANLGDLASGLLKSTFAMREEDAAALRTGLADRSVSVDGRGMLATTVAELSATVQRVNASGGLSLAAYDGRVPGVDVNHFGYAYDVRAARDGGLDWKDPGEMPGDKPKGDPTATDYLKEVFDSPVFLAAMSAAFVKAIDMAVKLVATKAAAAALGNAAKVAGGATAAGGTTTTGGGIVAGAAAAARLAMTRAGSLAAAAGEGLASLPAALAAMTTTGSEGWTMWGFRAPSPAPSGPDASGWTPESGVERMDAMVLGLDGARRSHPGGASGATAAQAAAGGGPQPPQETYWNGGGVPEVLLGVFRQIEINTRDRLPGAAQVGE